MLKSLGAEQGQVITLSHQLHGSKVVPVTSDTKVDFLSRELPEGDGLYTALKGVFLGARGADCASILFYSPSAGIVGAVHAGWRGTKEKILKKTLEMVINDGSATPTGFYFYIGPAAQVCCYEVSKYLTREKDFEFFFRDDLERRAGRVFLNFVAANIRQLHELGIKDERIENSGICSIHNQDYPSHRREKTSRRRTLLALIGRI